MTTDSAVAPMTRSAGNTSTATNSSVSSSRNRRARFRARSCRCESIRRSVARNSESASSPVAACFRNLSRNGASSSREGVSRATRRSPSSRLPASRAALSAFRSEVAVPP